MNPKSVNSFGLRVILLVLYLLFSGTAIWSFQVPTIADRGILPYGQYSFGEIENISQTSGVLGLSIPLAKLPAGRGGLGAELKLVYNSALYDTIVDFSTFDNTGSIPTPIPTNRMVVSPHGGWRYAVDYSFIEEYKPVYSQQQGCTIGERHDFKLRLRSPDGATRLLRLGGYIDALGNKLSGTPNFADVSGDGYYAYRPDGMAASCLGYPNLTNGRMIYYTTDGSYIRVEVATSAATAGSWWTNQWTVYSPDGSKATGRGPSTDSLWDRNDNRLDLVRISVLENGVVVQAVKLVDSQSRSIEIRNVSPVRDSILYKAFEATDQRIEVNFSYFNVGPRTYSCSQNNICSDSSFSLGRVASIVLPGATTTAATRTYTFEHSDCSACGGEINAVVTTTGSRHEYSWHFDNQTHWDSGLRTNSVSQKRVKFNEVNDGVTSLITETSNHCLEGRGNGCPTGNPNGISRITAPDGGITSAYFSYYGSDPIVYRLDYPDGSVVEREWRRNRVYTSPSQEFTNPYIRTEVKSAPNSLGVPTRASATRTTIDRNGNRTIEQAYDWVDVGAILRPGCNPPQCAIVGLPTGSVLLRQVTSGFFYSPGNAGDGSETVVDNVTAYWNPNAPRVLNSPSFRETDGPNGVEEYTAYVYDNAPSGPTKGNLTRTKRWDSEKGPDKLTNIVEEVMTYDVSGNLLDVVDGRGNTTRREYDSAREVLVSVKSANGQAIERSTSFTTDPSTGFVTGVRDVNNAVETKFTYDLFGRITLAREAADSGATERKTAIEYDDTLRRAIEYRDSDATNDRKLVTVRHYDPLLRLRLVQQLEDTATQTPTSVADGIKTQYRYRRDAAGFHTLVSRPYRAAISSTVIGESTMGWVRESDDRAGRPVATSTFSGAVAPAPWGGNAGFIGTVSTQYDSEYRTVTDEASKVRRFKADGMGRMVEVQDAGSVADTTKYIYDARGNLKQVEQGVQFRTFGYTSLSRLKSTKHPETTGSLGFSFEYKYDDAGNLQERKDAKGVTTTWAAYDGLNRPTVVQYSDGTPKVTYSYDTAINGKGRMANLASSAAEQRVGPYDKLGRITASSQITNGITYSLSYTHDLAGNLRSVTLPSQRVISYGVDAAGRPVQASGTKAGETAKTYRSSVTFASHGAMVSAKLGNNLWESMSYNGRLQPTLVGVSTAQVGPNDVLSLGYVWTSPTSQNNGNVWQQTIGTPGFSQTQTYEYDGLNRISSAKENSGTSWRRDFGYDVYGNMWVSLNTALPVSATMPTQLSHFSAATNRLAGVAYDDAGNQLGVSPSVASYDGEGRMISDQAVILSNTYERTYFYDGRGKRVRKVGTENGVRVADTVFVYDAFGKAVAEYSTSSGTNGTEYLSADPLGSTRLVTNDAAGVLARRDYLPFGEEIPAGIGGRPGEFEATTGQSRRFTGKERDAETGLDYFGARYLSAAQGRFTSPDPHNIITEASSEEEFGSFLSNPQNWNRYAYVTNNPLSITDPDGRCPWCPLFQRLSPYADKALTAAQRYGSQAIQAGQSYGRAGYLWATSFFNSPAGQQAIQTTAGLATGTAMPGSPIDGVGAQTGSRILTALGSSDAAKQMEGKVAQSLANSGLLRGFDVTVAGRQIDAIAGKTGQFVVEVTTGGGRGKIGQALAQMKDTGRQVVIYGEDLSKGFVREAQKQGIRVAQNLDELKKLVGGQ